MYTPEGRQALFATLAAVMVPPRSTAAAAARGRAAAEAAAGGGGGGSGRAAAVAGGGGGGSPAEAKAEPGPEDEAAAAGAAAACGSGAAAAQPGPDPAGEPQPGSGGGEGGEGGRGEVADGPGGQGGQGGQREEAEAAAWLCGSGDVVGGSVAVLAFEERPGVEEVPALCEAYGLACVEVGGGRLPQQGVWGEVCVGGRAGCHQCRQTRGGVTTKQGRRHIGTGQVKQARHTRVTKGGAGGEGMVAADVQAGPGWCAVV